MTRLESAAIVGLVALAALTAALAAVAIERSPLVWGDETYLASAAYSVSTGGDGVPTLLAPGSWNRPFPKAYGPLFFTLGSWTMRGAGIRPVSVRALSLAGALLVSASAFALVRAFGGTLLWASFAAAMLWLSPEIGSSATNGRMDTLAVGFEVLGLAVSLIAAGSPSRRRSALLTLATGAAWACAALCTPRTYPFFFAAGMLGTVTWIVRKPERRIAVVWGVALAIVAGAIACWLAAYGTTPREWIGLLTAGVTTDQFNGIVAAPRREWGISAKTALTPFIAVAAIVFVWAFGAKRWSVRARPGLEAAVWLTIVHAALYAIIFNYAFFAGIYFSQLLLAVALAVSGSGGLTPQRRAALVAVWLCVATLCLAARTLKLVEAAATWQGRDPAPLEQFVRDHVPPGSLVFGLHPVYFYAVTRSGSLYRSFATEPYPGSPTIGRRPPGARSTTEQLRPGVLAAERYLLWPIDEPLFPYEFACARPGIARFEPPASRANAITRLSWFARYAYLHTYPETVLYRLPAACHVP